MGCDERPREKMLHQGASALSNAELMALVLRTGTEGVNVIEVAQYLMKEVGGSLTKASRMSISELCKIEGIGPGKAACLLAALELGKRLVAEAPDAQQNIIKSSTDVYRMMIPEMRGLDHEECWIFFLTKKNRLINRHRLSIGTDSETSFDLKSIVRMALDCNASIVILVHNHPSGDPHPGNNDVTLTLQLRKALRTFNIHLLDHIVISDGLYYSFTDDSVSTMK